MGIVAKKLGLRIKELRELRGFTQLRLAEILSMEASNLSKIERGVQIPKEESLIRLAAALNVEINDLFDYTHFENKEILIEKINQILAKSDIEKIQKMYKILKNI